MFNVEFSLDNNFNTEFSGQTLITVSDHNKLTNRDLTDQHPINSITDLNKRLNAKLNANEAMTNAEIQQILGW